MASDNDGCLPVLLPLLLICLWVQCDDVDKLKKDTKKEIEKIESLERKVESLERLIKLKD